MTIHIERGSLNVYEDLGFADAEEMFVKAQLAQRIGEIILARRWTQVHAARVLGMSQPKLSKMLAGHFHGISEAKMLDYLTRLGSEVKIVIGPASETAAVTPVSVVFA